MQTVEILGVPASPYTRKMLALLRYRRIPYRVLWGSHIAPPAGYPVPKVKLLPTVYLQTDAGREALVDSTPIIDRLEALQSERVAASGILKTMTHPKAGDVHVFTPPVRVDGNRLPVKRLPPLLGDSTQALLKELLKMTDQEISQLKQLKIV